MLSDDVEDSVELLSVFEDVLVDDDFEELVELEEEPEVVLPEQPAKLIHIIPANTAASIFFIFITLFLSFSECNHIRLLYVNGNLCSHLHFFW